MSKLKVDEISSRSGGGVVVPDATLDTHAINKGQHNDKADKVSGATDDDIAGLDGDGDLKSLGAQGTAFNKNFGTGADDVCAGNDSRLEANHYSATIATTDWSGSDPVTAVKIVAGIASTDKPIIDLDMSGVAFADVQDVLDGWTLVYRIESSDTDELTFYALDTPTEDLTINIMVVK